MNIHEMYHAERDSKEYTKCFLPDPSTHRPASPDIHTLDINNQTPEQSPYKGGLCKGR
jgi:hypothetical protein